MDNSWSGFTWKRTVRVTLKSCPRNKSRKQFNCYYHYYYYCLWQQSTDQNCNVFFNCRCLNSRSSYCMQRVRSQIGFWSSLVVCAVVWSHATDLMLFTIIMMYLYGKVLGKLVMSSCESGMLTCRSCDSTQPASANCSCTRLFWSSARLHLPVSSHTRDGKKLLFMLHHHTVCIAKI